MSANEYVNEYALGINIVNASNMHDKVVYTKVLESTFFLFFSAQPRERERAVPGANRDKLPEKRIKILKNIHKLFPGKNALILKKLLKLLLHEK